MIYAIIVAAGQGLRMGTSQRKQFLKLAGKPILAHTISGFEACQAIDQIILVVPASQFDYCRKDVIEPEGFKKPISLVPGGERRQDSVNNGIGQIPEREGIVLIHDGVRPLVTVDIIEACIEGAKQWGACIPTIPPVDTLKQIGGNGTIKQTIARQSVGQAQTPQAFKLSIIRKAHKMATVHGWKATDDAALVERIGIDVHVVAGRRENLKITTSEDLALAQFYLSHRGG